MAGAVGIEPQTVLASEDGSGKIMAVSLMGSTQKCSPRCIMLQPLIDGNHRCTTVPVQQARQGTAVFWRSTGCSYSTIHHAVDGVFSYRLIYAAGASRRHDKL